jgi:hypothetical protein
MKLNLKLAKLLGIWMFLTIISFTLLQAQRTPTQEWRRIGPWGGNITSIKVKYINDSSLALSGAGDAKDSIIVASYGAGIYIKDAAEILDNSIAWTPRNSGLPSLKVLSLASRNIGQGDSMYAGLDGYGIYRTTDAGKNWEPAFGMADYQMRSAVVNDIAIHPNQSWIAYAATSTGLWRTTSFGGSWVKVRDGKFDKVTMHEYYSQKVYALSEGQLYRTTTMGTSWQGPFSANGSKMTAIRLACSALDTVYVGCDDGTVREITFPGEV